MQKVHNVSIVGNLSLSILVAIFPGGPKLAGASISLFWILLELRMMKVVVTAGTVTRKVPVKSSPPTNPNPSFYRPNAPDQHCQCTEGESTEGKRCWKSVEIFLGLNSDCKSLKHLQLRSYGLQQPRKLRAAVNCCFVMMFV